MRPSMALLRGKTKVGKIGMRASIHLGLFRMNVVSLLLLTCAGLGAGSSLADVKSQADNLLLAQNQEASSSKKESRQSATDKKSSSSDRGEGTPVQAGSFRNAALFAVLLTVLIT